MGAIECYQQIAVERAKWLQISELVKRVDNVGEHRQRMLGRDGIEQSSDVVVTGGLVHPKESSGIALAFGDLHGALEGEKRGTLSEEHRERSERGIFEGVAGVVAGAPVGELREELAQSAHQRVKCHGTQTLFERKADGRVPVVRCFPTSYTRANGKCPA